jgi:hypothetical protein
LIFLVPTLAKVSSAMLLARRFRGVESISMVARETVGSVFASSALSYDPYNNGTGYDEFYYSDPFLSRLANPKFIDNSLSVRDKLGEAGNQKLASLEEQKLVAILPAPIINVLDIPVDKVLVNGYSVGDYEWYLYTGEGLGFMLTTSFVGDGPGLLGFMFLPITVLAALAWFPVLDCLTRVVRVRSPGGPFSDVRPVRFETRMSSLFAPTAFIFASFFVQRAAMVEFFLFFRDAAQLLLAYALVFWLTGLPFVKPRVRLAKVSA